MLVLRRAAADLHFRRRADPHQAALKMITPRTSQHRAAIKYASRRWRQSGTRDLSPILGPVGGLTLSNLGTLMGNVGRPRSGISHQLPQRLLATACSQQSGSGGQLILIHFNRDGRGHQNLPVAASPSQITCRLTRKAMTVRAASSLHYGWYAHRGRRDSGKPNTRQQVAPLGRGTARLPGQRQVYPQVRPTDIQPSDGPPDDHLLDFRRGLEDGEDPGDRGSLCRSAACSTPWYQHGFSTPGPRRIPVFGRPRARLACGAQTRFSRRTRAASKLEDALGGLLRNGYIAGTFSR
jgi:hypothetical protein